MSKYSKTSYLFLVLMLFFTASQTGFAQNKNELEEKKKELQKEISLTNKLLNETKKNKELTLDEVLKLKSKISLRVELISAIDQEIRFVNKQINRNQDVILSLQKDLEKLKQEYAKMIYYAFKNKSTYNKIMFVFSSSSFNQAYKRLKYIQQYSEYRKKQGAAIVETQRELIAKIAELEKSKQEKSALLSLEQQEKQKLAVEQAEQETNVKKLQSKEQELRSDLNKKQEAERKLQKAIERIIEEEIRKAREAAAKANKGSSTTSESKTSFPMTPEALKLSNSFASNKGSLPWPVAEGIITDRFGQHPHPVLSGIIINNNGIDISTTKGAIARAIFDGEVSSVAIIPGGGKVVMIRHGEYLSVYSYLSEVYVNKGDKISTKQHLGTLISEPDKAKTNVHLEIWKGMTKLNPEYWIFRK
ncbi:MAG: peptidoglycan DD-metalloendopeptidase family protein [Flavobacteriales bacterium]|nr:peptidoglycan DD-metalloendopeptidase family protein [Flavobacteriales bacterium]MCB9174539.1 peptidoglycan DD-metalloendopeptidase family protein [Flavobacteriales bacterium]